MHDSLVSIPPPRLFLVVISLRMIKVSAVYECMYGVVNQRLPYSCQDRPLHDDVIRWKRFPRYWPFVRGIHRSPVKSPHKGQWHGALMFSLIWATINDWVNNGEAGDLRRHRAHYDVNVMHPYKLPLITTILVWVTTSGKIPLIAFVNWKMISSSLRKYVVLVY